MNEIEIKAHVYKKDELIKKLNSFAEFKQEVFRDDTYYESPLNPKVKIRIRKEKCGKTTRSILTYKRKEIKSASENSSTELNEELETEILSSEPLEQFFCDAGFKVALKKHKEVLDWELELPSSIENTKLKATLELCNVPPLGYFLEIEILSSETEPQKIQKLQDLLLEVLDLVQIPRSKIESRYYSEMLREAAASSESSN